MAFNPSKCLCFVFDLMPEQSFTLYHEPSATSGAPYYFSMDDGATWEPNMMQYTNWSSTSEIIHVFVKGTGYPCLQGIMNPFQSDTIFDVGGSVMSLVDDGAGEANTIEVPYGFYGLFCGTPVRRIDSGLLSAQYLSVGCYNSMFDSTSFLTTVPSGLLPAEMLADRCYEKMFRNSRVNEVNCTISQWAMPQPYCFAGMFAYTEIQSFPDNFFSPRAGRYQTSEHTFEGMFEGCTELTTVPTCFFNYTHFEYSCCERMFSGCTSIVSLPNNIFTNTETIYAGAFREAFKGCTSLTTTNADTSCPMVQDEGFKSMFEDCRALTELPPFLANLIHGGDGTCERMFYGCSNLQLKSTDKLVMLPLKTSCYKEMFCECTSLTSVPENFLSETNLAESCYEGMFKNCTELSLAADYKLPATQLVSKCYMEMFKGCIKLMSLPVDILQVDSLAPNCCEGMFENTGITVVPEGFFPNLDPISGCYDRIFYSCDNLNEIHAPFDKWKADGSTDATVFWVYQVAPTGTFYATAKLPDIRDYGHIPTNWRIVRPNLHTPYTMTFGKRVKVGRRT